MTLPTSGPISLLNLQEEFGGANPIALNEYYRGGTYVSTALSQIPATGPLGINAFYGISTAVSQGAALIKQSNWGGSFSLVGGQWLWGEVLSNQGYKYVSGDLKTRVTDVSNLAALVGSSAESIPRGCITTGNNRLLSVVVSTSVSNVAYVAYSTDNGSTWALAVSTNYVEVTNWPLSTGPIFMVIGQLYGQRVIAAFGHSNWTNTVINKKYVGASGSVSTDNGDTWADITLPAISNTSSQATYPTVNGGVYCHGLGTNQGGDGLFILSANDGLYTAPNCSGFTKRYAYDVSTGSVVTGVAYKAPAFGNNVFVAGSASNGRIITSTDGANFYQQVAVPNLAGVHAIGFGNGYFVMVGSTTMSAPNNVALWTSADGVSWDFHQQIGLSAVTAVAVESSGGRFYIQMSDGSAWAANA